MIPVRHYFPRNSVNRDGNANIRPKGKKMPLGRFFVDFNKLKIEVYET